MTLPMTPAQALAEVIDFVERDIIMVTPSNRAEFLAGLERWNSAMSNAQATAHDPHSFEAIAEKNGLVILDQEQVAQLMEATSNHLVISATQRIAHDELFEKLLISKAGRLAYNAGFEYSAESILIESPEMTLYDVSGKTADECNVVAFLESIRDMYEHENGAVVEDDLPSP